VDRTGFRFVINDEQVAAEAVAGRLHQADGRVGRDRRVDRVAAALENLHAGARGQRLARRHDPKGRRHYRSADDRSPTDISLLLCGSGTESARAGQCEGEESDGHVSNVHGTSRAAMISSAPSRRLP
jgi:hypothetical protein